jgi:alanine dehydrogenase
MVLLLGRSDVERLLDITRCIDAVEDAFRQRAAGQAAPSAMLGVHVDGGAFHVKAAALLGGATYFVAKVNANFPSNPSLRGLPTIQGVLALFDASSGIPLAVMDSMSVTALRTAAATAVAARWLSRPDASTLTIAGCGVQGRAHLAALAAVRRLSHVYAHDSDHASAERFAAEMSQRHGPLVETIARLEDGTLQSDLIVTCTPSREAILDVSHVSGGTFIAAVGADNAHKQEIAPELMAASRVVVDDLEQCTTIGDLHHAIERGLMTRESVHAELADVVLDPNRGRRDPNEIVVFDSTGVAIEDVAAAAVIYERAVQERVGIAVDLSA